MKVLWGTVLEATKRRHESGSPEKGDAPMELIIDSADLAAVREFDERLCVSGVTTNPSITIRSGKRPEEAYADLLGYLSPDQKFFVQVISTDVEGMLAEARAINALREKNTYAKIPVTDAGMIAIKRAKQEGLNVLATGIHSAEQGFLAALSGADYLAPYVNRMCNFGDGVGQVIDLINMLSAAGLPARVMAASFHNVGQVHELLCAGIQAVTLPPAIIRKMMEHPGTEKAVSDFSAEWHEAYGRDTLFA